MRTTLAVLALALALPSSGGEPVRWHASTKATLDAGRTLGLDRGKHALTLAGGWSCVVGEVSVNEARITACRKGEAVIEFSVQCDAGRSRDDAQVRFPAAHDFIEVGCETR